MVDPDKATDGNTIRPLPFVSWINKPADTHSEYVILVTFPLQQRLRERASVIRFTHTVSCILLLRLLWLIRNGVGFQKYLNQTIGEENFLDFRAVICQTCCQGGSVSMPVRST